MFDNLLKKVLYPLQAKDIKKLYLILFLTILTAFFELLGIGLIIPILNIFAGNEFQKYLQYFDFLGNITKENLLNIFLFLLVFVYFLKFFIVRSLIYIQNEFSHRLFTDISKKFFKNYLFKNFTFHLSKNSSELIRNIQTEANLFSFGVVFSLVRLFSEIIIFIAICTALITYEWQASIVTIVVMSSSGYIFLKMTNDRLKRWGNKRQLHSTFTLKHLQQGFASIREIILNNLENIFLDKYHYHNLENAKAGRNKDTITQLPRLILELIGVTTFLILIMFLLNTGKNISEIFIIIGVFFFAATRLLPSISKMVQSVQSIKFNNAVIDLVYNELIDFNNNKNNRKEEKLYDQSFIFNNINLEKVNFSYSTNKKVILNNVNIEIKKNDKIGIIGKTGSGKSTLLNLLTGLLECQQGKIKINGKELKENISSWQRMIGYVPQHVSILDESILFNITLESDLNKINIEKINRILKTVDLYDHIYSLPHNLYELAGENGKNFSGGQRQRLGIARALYKDPSILILDEATSSLDQETENLVLNTLFDNVKEITILSVSHKRGSLRFCDKIYEVKDKNVMQELS
tara:strand:+ start:1693 stop:3423 length:1731 start_codon:yes stop_codon:yes gene_type:complete